MMAALCSALSLGLFSGGALHPGTSLSQSRASLVVASEMSVDQAASFLSSPEVSGISVEDRVAYLKEKSVADSSISAALAKAGLAVQVASSASSTDYPTEQLMAMGGGMQPETGGKIFDPLELASPKYAFLGSDSAKLAWYRTAEIKHGRVAMAAFLGWIAAANGAALWLKDDMVVGDPLATWAAIPDLVKGQILLLAGAVEFVTETQSPHYTKGGKIGQASVPFGWAPLGMAWGSDDQRNKAALEAELKNGRLAMIGIAGFYLSSTIPGSVPGLSMLGA